MMLNILLIVGSCIIAATFTTAASASPSQYPPVFFFPGYGASYLYATILTESAIPASCAGSDLPINTRIDLSRNISLSTKYPQCLYDLLTLQYKKETKEFLFPDGIVITTGEMGSFSSITSNYYSFPKELISWGYKEQHNLFAIPYDYRLMSSQSFERIGWVDTVKQLIEKSYEHNGHRKALIIGHSNGGPTMYSFVQSSFLTQAWKDKYLAAMIPLSGNLLGQMNCIYDAVKPQTAYLAMTWTWEGNYGSLPWGDYEPVRTIPIVTTYSNTPQEVNYTSTLQDLQALFLQANQSSWVEMITGIYERNMMNRTALPMIDTYCLYGSNLPTSYQFVFAGEIQQTEPILIRYMDGDNNQDIIDNEFCMIWKTQQQRLQSSSKEQFPSQVVPSYIFQSESFPNVGHMEMVSNVDVFAKIKEIVELYSV